MTLSGKGEGNSGGGYEVAVAVMLVGDVGSQPDTSSERSGGHLPGYDDAIGRPWGPGLRTKSFLLFNGPV